MLSTIPYFSENIGQLIANNRDWDYWQFFCVLFLYIIFSQTFEPRAYNLFSSSTLCPCKNHPGSAPVDELHPFLETISPLPNSNLSNLSMAVGCVFVCPQIHRRRQKIPLSKANRTYFCKPQQCMPSKNFPPGCSKTALCWRKFRSSVVELFCIGGNSA